jgi:hypothetical protein
MKRRPTTLGIEAKKKNGGQPHLCKPEIGLKDPIFSMDWNPQEA